MSNLMSDDNSDENITIAVGTKAPDFQHKNETGTSRRLSDNLAEVIAPVFCPKNETPACTKKTSK